MSPESALAAPVIYNVQPGSEVDISVVETPNNPIASTTAALSLTSSITVDDVTFEILSIDFVLVPGTTLTLSSAFGGYDEIELATVTVETTGSSNINRQALGPVYTFDATAIEVAATYSASDSQGVQTPTGPESISFPTNTTGLYNANTNALNLYAVQLGLVPGAPFGESEDLIVRADFDVQAGPTVPEPSTGLLFAAGLAWLVRRSRLNKRTTTGA